MKSKYGLSKRVTKKHWKLFNLTIRQTRKCKIEPIEEGLAWLGGSAAFHRILMMYRNRLTHRQNVKKEGKAFVLISVVCDAT